MSAMPPIKKSAMSPIKKNDEVFVLRGKDRGKSGRVLIVMPRDQKIVVEGIQMISGIRGPTHRKNVKGGIVEKEAPIHVSNVAMHRPPRTHCRRS